jgi:hypothetical protein
MPQNIGYDGIPEFNKQRRLVDETNIAPESLQDDKPPLADDRQQATEELFRGLAKTYLKGNLLKKGLAGMDPAAYIPITDDAPEVAAAARRLAESESKQGAIITYAMYQRSVDEIHEQKWKSRRKYFNTDIPVTGRGQAELAAKTSKTEKDGIFDAFVNGVGAAGALLGALAIAPFMADVFLALSNEEAASKASFTVKAVAGIAILIEIGVKVAKIIELLKSLKVSIPNAEQVVNELATSREARNRALQNVGLNHDELVGSLESDDHKKILEYTSEYYKRYGGLIGPGEYLTIDHWIAYLHVAQNQLMIRGALDISDTYSKKFAELRTGSSAPVISSSETSINDSIDFPRLDISNGLVSSTRALRERSNDIYDDILNAFMYQVTDTILCCLVSLFGAFKDTQMMRTIAAILRLLAMDFGLELANLLNQLMKYVTNMIVGALFQLVCEMDKLMQKIMLKVAAAFTVNIPGLENCIGLISLGWCILEAIQALFKIIKDLIREIMAIISSYSIDMRGWEAAGDRRHLLGIARILEVLANKLDAAKICDVVVAETTPPEITEAEISQIAAGDVIYNIIGEMPPSLALTNQEIEKYFGPPQSRTSKRLKFNYGILDMQNAKRREGNNCMEPLPQDALDEIVGKLKSILSEQ